MRFKPYPRYKASGVEWLGDVPVEWESWRLRFGIELNPSKSECANLARDTMVTFLPMEAISENGEIDRQREKPISEVETGYTYFRDGDVVMAKITPCFENGKGARVAGLANGIGFGTTELVVARSTGKTDGRFVQWLFMSQPFRKLGEGHMYGAGGQKRLPDDFVRNFSIAWPSPNEQFAIANFLDHETAKIDTLIAKQETMISLLKEKRQAVISHAVTKGLDPTVAMKPSGLKWLGDVPEHWMTSPIKHIMSMSSGGTPNKDRPDFWDGAHPWASAKDLKVEALADTQDHISELAISEGGATLVEPGAVLIVVRGMILLHTLPVTVNVVPMAINQDLKALRSGPNCDPGYLAALLRGLSKEILGRTDQAAHGTKALRESDWIGMHVPLPPIADQLAIVQHISSTSTKIDTLIAKAQQAIVLQKEHRTALISAAVTGKIDVRNEVIERKAA